MTDRRHRADPDGFTLVELLISVTVIGIIAAGIAAVFTVIVRTAPAAEARADDARSLMGVTTWFPTDVGATPQMPLASAAPYWDTTPTRASGCSGTDPGTNLARLSWTESLSGTPTTFIAAYRLLDEGSTSRIVRVTCRTGALTAEVQRVTANLPPVGASPVSVTWKTATRSSIVYVVGAELSITTIEGDTLRVDASSRNPNQTLGTVPSAVTTTTTPSTTTTPPSTTPSTTTPTTTTVAGPNQPPTAGPVSFTARRDQPIVFALAATDPNGDPLTVTFGPLPSGWTPTVAGLNVTMAAANPAAGTYPIAYTVTDPSGATASSTITVVLTPVPCVASFVSVLPNPVDRAQHGAGAYPLASPVVVTITKSGDCADLVLRYTPDTIARTIVFGDSIVATIPADASVSWTRYTHVLQLVVQPGPGEIVLGTTTLTVNN